MELSLIGLQNAGKTSLVNVIASNDFHEDMIPTVGFNMRKVTKGAITIKLWDLGGQARGPPPPSPLPVAAFPCPPSRLSRGWCCRCFVATAGKSYAPDTGCHP